MAFFSSSLDVKMAAPSGEGVSVAKYGVLSSLNAPSSSMEDNLTCEMEATVCTGFEPMAVDEIEEKLGLTAAVSRGRVNVVLPVGDARKMLELRSVDNVMVIVSRFPHFQFSEKQEEALLQIRSLVPRVNWLLALKVWSQFFDFPYPISVGEKQTYGTSDAAVTNEDVNQLKSGLGDEVDGLKQLSLTGNRENNAPDNTVNDSCLKGSSDESLQINDEQFAGQHDSLLDVHSIQVSQLEKSRLKQKNPQLPSYRATCHRTGEHHSFQSPSAAAHFGGEMHNYFGWNVDLEHYDIEAILYIEDDDIRVGISLTRESLHRRDIAHFGPTTLRPTIAHGMLRMCKIVPGESVCDPMCGGGSIPVEAALCWPSAHHFCGDLDKKAVERAFKNLAHLNAKRQCRQLVEDKSS